jgi:prephenate dehydrogenase
MLPLKELKQITVIGMGLLGGSVSRAILRCFPRAKVTGYSHRASTREKARQLAVASQIADNLELSLAKAELVILATPICTFEEIFSKIAPALPRGCIVTDVGSTKVLSHRWAAKRLPETTPYVGSHPIAGSEQRGVEFARDDLFEQTSCILTKTKSTKKQAIATLREFWTKLGCSVMEMSPSRHDRIFGMVSHLPHITAASLLNANSPKDLEFAGSGFMDTSRIASGPANVWADILLTNAENSCKGIDKLIAELTKIKAALKKADKDTVEKLLTKAREKRAALINYKIKRKELL